jgi:dihydrofolate reductase
MSMRKLTVGLFVSLDGVMQAPGGPEEDTTRGFSYGGWIAPFRSEATIGAVGALFAKPFDLILGRATYDSFAAHWPYDETDPAAETYDAGGARNPDRESSVRPRAGVQGGAGPPPVRGPSCR